MIFSSRSTFCALACTALLLSGCGGAGSDRVASIPSPSPTQNPTPSPTPSSTNGATDRLITGATASQAMAMAQYTPNSQGGLTVAYDAATRHYLVTTPADTTPQALQRNPFYTPQPGDPWRDFTLPNGFHFLIRASAEDPDPQFRYTYSNLVAWGYSGTNGFGGISAFGIPTPASAVPRNGVGTFTGFLEGSSSETYVDGLAGKPLNAGLSGSVNLTFDFAAAKLSGVIAPKLEVGPSYALGSLQLTNADWAVGSPTFSAQLAGGSVVASSLQGRFTGPAAEELIGRFSFGYTSPIDASAQTAGGAFIAKRSSGQ